MTAYSSALTALANRLCSLSPRRDVELAPYTTFRIGGPADLFYEATSADHQTPFKLPISRVTAGAT